MLTNWGYSRDAARLTSVISHLLLLNRSPFLHDLAASTLTEMRADAGLGRQQRKDFHGVHRAISALGYADPPPAPKHGDGPHAIEGTAPGWADWVERWYATSTITPKARSAFAPSWRRPDAG